MQIIYKCDCMATEVRVEMRERGDNEDIVAWVIEAKQALKLDHARRSPSCNLLSQPFTRTTQ
jgi:hypothetical protein